MTAFIIYLIITTLIGFAMALSIVGNESSLKSMATFFNPKVLRSELDFSIAVTIIVSILGHIMMPVWAVAYWVVKLVKGLITK